MGYVVYKDSLHAAEEWVKRMNVTELDFGSNDLNAFVRTLSINNLISIRFSGERGYSNKTSVMFLGTRNKFVEYVVEYYGSGHLYDLKRDGHSVLPEKQSTQDGFATSATLLFKKSALVKWFLPLVTYLYDEHKRRKEEQARRDTARYEADPRNWSKEKQEAEYASLKEYLETSGDQYLDDYSVWEGYNTSQKLFQHLSEILGK